MNQSVRRTIYVLLCVFPFIALSAAAAHPLRVAGMHHVIGGILFAAVALAAWVVGSAGIRLKEAGSLSLAAAGLLLILPWAIISLLWVGIGPPFQASLSENFMRYIVLVWNSIFVTIGFVVLNDALHEAGERFYSTLGFATALVAGAAYLICLNLSLAHAAMALHGDQTPQPAILGIFYSAIEFVACVMTYVTTAAFAAALWRVRLLGGKAALGYVTVSVLLVLLIIMRGLAFPEISANTAPWYTRPGVIAGIPAIPWFMPCLLGAVLLRRAGEARP